MARMMRAARLHEPGKLFRIDEIPVPEPRPDDVVVAVRACGLVPNMRNIVAARYWHVLPRLPAIFGLDSAGEVAALGANVTGFSVGDRVYINPALSCGACEYCRRGLPLNCDIGALQGYFGFRVGSEKLMDLYPYGGFCEYQTAPARNLVKLPPEVSFDVGARFGYLGTTWAGLQTGGAKTGDTLAIIGATGTLGVHAVIFGLALGLSRIVPLARNRERLDRLKALAPERIFPVVIDGEPVADRIRAATGGLGADLVLDCLTRGVPADTTNGALKGLRRGGIAVNIGALNQPVTVDPIWLMVNAIQYRGSNWFTVAQGEEMARLAGDGLVDFSSFENRVYRLEQVNDALEDVGRNHGGFVNIVVRP
jgi:alcohol dehydrogenase